MNWLPGVDITSAQPELLAQLIERRTRPSYTPFEAMCLSHRVGKEVLVSPFFAPERYLAYYEKPNCPRHNRLRFVAREELIQFLDDRIRPERMEGVDLTVTTFEMREFLITNHDGDMWLRRPSEWPNSSDVGGTSREPVDASGNR